MNQDIAVIYKVPQTMNSTSEKQPDFVFEIERQAAIQTYQQRRVFVPSKGRLSGVALAVLFVGLFCLITGLTMVIMTHSGESASHTVSEELLIPTGVVGVCLLVLSALMLLSVMWSYCQLRSG